MYVTNGVCSVRKSMYGFTECSTLNGRECVVRISHRRPHAVTAGFKGGTQKIPQH
jgi:hypothetical protein